MEENWLEREDARGEASFELRFDLASLDQFVQELFNVGESKKGKATLRGNIDNKDAYGQANFLMKLPLALIAAIFLGLVLPIAFFLLMVESCPHSGGLAYFPFFSAQCTGEFIGTAGLFLTALPGIIIGFLFVLFVATYFEKTGMTIPLLEQFTSEGQLILVASLATIVNILFYWVIIRLVSKGAKRLATVINNGT
jgi:hypothetical protein